MRSLASRVALATAITIAVAALFVALVSMILEDRIASAREDARLLDALETLATELAEPGADPQAVGEDEQRELAHSGIHLAIFEGGVFRGGDPAVLSMEAGTCTVSEGAHHCAIRRGGLTLVAHRRPAEEPSGLMLALMAAVSLAVLLGALVARRIAAWSIAPLERLTTRVRALDLETTSVPELGADERVEEVDALRGALGHSFSRWSDSVAHARAFAGDAAHELRTPLTAMRGELELLAERLDEAGDLEAVERVQSTTERLSTLVDRLLILARPGEALEGTEAVDLRDVVEDAVQDLSPEQRARVSTEVPEESFTLEGDATLLRTLMACGLSNALKFSVEGPVVVRLQIQANDAVLEIDDEGPGVPPEEREASFQRLHRSSAARTSGPPGHGIGLSLVAHVAKLHKGRASLEDGAKGARLRVTLPLR